MQVWFYLIHIQSKPEETFIFCRFPPCLNLSAADYVYSVPPVRFPLDSSHPELPSMPCSSSSVLELLMLEENAYQETQRWTEPLQLPPADPSESESINGPNSEVSR
ncbi:hypothetical protein ATANTOWER_002170 [Ataeniobius toweri]|uniref:Uncharacterized protein n=1 Tax=Ataeniobius toweri TaxID=208326 RepID=A0ABU7AE36_9TELE|nr:hypothetical protein [Ataeniobius toweri]